MVQPRAWVEHATGREFELSARPFDRAGAFCGLGNPQAFRRTLQMIGVDAVDLESGKVLWHSNEAAFPLLVYKNRLLAQDSPNADPMRIVALDIENCNGSA